MSFPSLMTFAELETAMAQFSYRPGWTFSAYFDRYLGPSALIIAPVLNGYDPARAVDLGIRSRIPPHAMRSESDLAEWLLWRLIEAEIHEAREFLRCRGELVDDPHQPGG